MATSGSAKGTTASADGGRLTRRAAILRAGGIGAAGSLAAVAVPHGVLSESDGGCACGESAAGADCGCGEHEPVAPSATLATLPETAPEQAGRLRRLTDYDRGLWLDTGERWVSVRNHIFDVRSFGAAGDGETDDWPAFSAALEAMRSWIDADSTSADGHTLFVPPGAYRLAQSLVMNRAVTLTGAGGGGGSADVVLRFDAGLAGIVIEGEQAGLTGTPGRAGSGAIVERLRIEASGSNSASAEGQPAVPAYGVWLRTRATLRQLAVVGFGTDGIRVEGSEDQPGTATAGWAIEGCEARECGGHGLGVSRASGGVCTGLVTVDNAGAGIADDSEHGNTYLHCHAAGNRRGGFVATGETNRSVFAGCGAEGGQPQSAFEAGIIIVGGNFASGFRGGNAWTADGSRMLLRAQTPVTSEGGSANAPTLELRAVQRQAEPHLRVTASDGARQAELDPAGRLTLGDPGAIHEQAGEGGPGAARLTLVGPGAAIGFEEPADDGAPSFVGRIQAFRDAGGADSPAAAGVWLGVQTANAAGQAVETLALREGRVGIGTTAPAPGAILDLVSTAQAFLPPRMTSEQRDAIAGPPEGSTIYNLTTHRLNVHDGTQWREVPFAEVQAGG